MMTEEYNKRIAGPLGLARAFPGSDPPDHFELAARLIDRVVTLERRLDAFSVPTRAVDESGPGCVVGCTCRRCRE